MGNVKNMIFREGVLWSLCLAIVLFPLAVIHVLGIQADSDTWDQVFYRPTYLALRNSYGVFLTQTFLIIPPALIVGVASGLFDFPFRRLSLFLSLFPLVLPSFITAIGIQSLNMYLPYEHMRLTDGFLGCVWTGMTMSFPIAVWGVFLAVKSIPSSELESVLLLKGKWMLFWLVTLK